MDTKFHQYLTSHRTSATVVLPRTCSGIARSSTNTNMDAIRDVPAIAIPVSTP
jgi:hypothetical protein